MILTALATLFLVLAALSLAWLVLIHLLAWAYFRRGPATPGDAAATVGVSVIRPVWQVTAAARDELASFCAQDHAGPVEILFCLDPRDEMSLPVVQEVVARAPRQSARIVPAPPTGTDPVGKLDKMLAGVAHARHDVLAFADDDVQVPRSYLRDAVPWLADPRVGLVFSAPAYRGALTWPAALMARFTNALVVRVAAACLPGLFDGASGIAMLTRRSVLERVGGLEALAGQVAEDLALGRAVWRRGYRIRLLASPAPVVHPHDTLARCWWNLHRWLVVLRRYYPVRYPVMMVLDLGLWWALLHTGLTLLGTGTPGAGACLVPALALGSVVSAAIVNATFVRDPRAWRFLWVAVLLELLRLPLAVHSGVTSRILWRGRWFRVNRDGTVTELSPPPSAARRDPGAMLAAEAGAGTRARSER